LSNSTYGVLASSQVSPEFRFAIDQVFEAYAWLPGVISKTLQLAPDQAATVANYRDHWRGLESSLMLAEAVTDQSLHLPLDSEEANQLAGIIFQETLGLKVSEPLNWIQVLGPSMRRGGGLAFTELWGITDSQKMIKKLHGVNPLVPTEVSKKFRKEVLEMADQQPAQELIKNFSR
jgi:hypothetical protein